ncbi:MAG: hypothetical protein OHK93_006926 [Ramalina farinacea]|uniref:Aromatic prenyltransferase n=1 Tax=Ramalina farinacea TaxID=258253 RepID=A0AA43QNS7_9LECA|nr:hypothetical protein [Ramalina farinacea]
MREAGYMDTAHKKGLEFFDCNVVSHFEAASSQSKTRRWRSFMTDDFSPFEFSWSWESSPKIRYSFEPVGTEAGTLLDCCNRKGPLACAADLQRTVPSSDWRMFHFFANVFYDSEADIRHRSNLERETSSPSSIFFALELNLEDPIIKAYLIPVVAEQTQQSRLSVLSKTLGQYSSELFAYPMLEKYIIQRQSHDPMQIIGLAVDCIDPAVARLRIYARSQDTSFKTVQSILTLDGRIPTWTNEMIADLWNLWKLVLNLPQEHSMDEPLGQVSHETSGMLYNFDIQPHKTLPETKVYIPVKHYGKNDRSIAEGLVTFLRENEQLEQTKKFMGAIERLCSYRCLEDGRGMQTYISCGVKSGRLAITSYISPELNHAGRR